MSLFKGTVFTNIFAGRITNTSGLCGHGEFCILHELDMESLDYDSDSLPNIYDEKICNTAHSRLCYPKEFSPTPGDSNIETETYYRHNMLLIDYFIYGNSSDLKQVESNTNKGNW